MTSQTSQTTIAPTLSISGIRPGSSYDRALVVMDPASLDIYSWAGVGGGSPEPIYRGHHPSIRVSVDADEAALVAWVEAHAEALLAAAVLSTSPDEDERIEGAQALSELEEAAADSIATRWDAGEWMGGDEPTVVSDAMRCSTLDEAVAVEISRAADDDVLLHVDDAVRALRDLLEDRAAVLAEAIDDAEDEDDADWRDNVVGEHAELAKIRALLS